MPRKKYAITPDNKRSEIMLEEADKLTGLDKALLDDLLLEYDALSSMVDYLRKDVQEKGCMYEKETGAANNRHIVSAERPEFTAYQKALKTKSDIAKKISDFASRSDEDEGEDDFDEFNAQVERK